MSVDVIFWSLTGFAFALGAVVGSFLNVVVHRVPAGMSLVSPPSHCPACETHIRWYDNIPIISWALLLRGECRHCQEPISGRYALIEGLTGFLSAALWVKVAQAPFSSMALLHQTPAIDYLLPFGLYFIFICLLVVITFVDLEHLIIPHSFTLPGMALGVAVPLIYNWALEPGALSGFWPPVTLWESVIGLVVGAVTVVAIFYGYFAVRGVAGIGGGDVTLMALVGAWLGWPALIFVFFAASLQGTLAAAAAMVFGGGLLRDSAEIYEEDELREQAEATLQADAVATLDEADVAVDDEEAPVEDDETPVDDDEAPVEDEEAPVEDEEAPVEDEEAPAKDEEAPVEDEEAPAEDEEAPAQPEEETTDETKEDASGGLAVPFGPFISLAALEHFFIGDMLPPVVSMSYLYQFGAW